MRKKLTEGRIVDPEYVEVVEQDFCKIVRILGSRNLLKSKNVSRHVCYILRICEYRGITPNVELKDLKEGSPERVRRDNIMRVVVLPN